jgi:excisionase family DNA binding protein
MTDRLLTVQEAGDLLNTGERFLRRLIAERRIRFVQVGRHWSPHRAAEKSERCRRSLEAGAAVNRVLIAVADRCGVVRGVDGYGSVICDVPGIRWPGRRRVS